MQPVTGDAALADKVEDYLREIPGARETRFNALHNLILERYPQVTVDMKYKMPTYHIGNNWVALANQKNYISLYTCDAEDIKTFKHNHPTIKTGKTCINFRESDELPLDDLADVLAIAFEI